MATRHSDLAHGHSKKLVEMHPKIVASVKNHGNILGMLHAASEGHAKHTSKGVSHPVHHEIAAEKAAEICALAQSLKKSAMAQMKLASQLENHARKTSSAHATACKACRQ